MIPIRESVDIGTGIQYVKPIYTGGEIYVYLGKFVDGTYFIAGTPDWDLRILDEDPDQIHPTDPESYDRAWDDSDWQLDHLVKDYASTDTQDFFNQMFDYILKNEPAGNYSLGDMEEQKKRNNNESGSKADRKYTEV